MRRNTQVKCQTYLLILQLNRFAIRQLADRTFIAQFYIIHFDMAQENDMAQQTFQASVYKK